MLTIKVIGPTPACVKCKRAEREAREAAKRFDGQVLVEKVDALSDEGQSYGLLGTPTVVLGDQVLASGKVLPAERLVAAIADALEKGA